MCYIKVINRERGYINQIFTRGAAGPDGKYMTDLISQVRGLYPTYFLVDEIFEQDFINFKKYS